MKLIPKFLDPITNLAKRVKYTATEIVSGKIPGNRGGASCGTLGGLVYLGDNLLATTYQKMLVVQRLQR